MIRKKEALCIYSPSGNLFYTSDSELAEIVAAGNMMNQFTRGHLRGNFRIKIKQRDYLAVFQNSETDESQIVVMRFSVYRNGSIPWCTKSIN